MGLVLEEINEIRKVGKALTGTVIIYGLDPCIVTNNDCDKEEVTVVSFSGRMYDISIDTEVVILPKGTKLIVE